MGKKKTEEMFPSYGQILTLFVLAGFFLGIAFNVIVTANLAVVFINSISFTIGFFFLGSALIQLKRIEKLEET
jgi:hypothetical protein